MAPNVELIKKEVSGHDDVLICCAGFEDRARGFVDKLSTYSCSKAFLLKYDSTKTTTPPATENEKHIRKKLEMTGEEKHVKEIEIDPLEPVRAVNEIIEQINEMKIQQCKISMDISAMSKSLLLIMLRGLLEHDLLGNLQIYYTIPKKYDEQPVASGANRMDVIPTFAGQHHPRAETVLLVLLGYEGDRSFSLYEQIEPDYCYLGYPHPPYNKEWVNRDKEQNRDIIAVVGENKLVAIESKNPVIVTEILEKRFKEFKDKSKNIVISPMGTKPQAVGVFFYYIKSGYYPTIMYSNPKSHGKYSEGIGDTYRLPIPSLQS